MNGKTVRRRKAATPSTDRPAWQPFQRFQDVNTMGEVGTVWENNLYTVIVSPNGPIIHLSIRDRDRTARHDWRDFQRIKNELVGRECEAIEIYPAESRLLDSANSFHLWAFADPAFRLPIGYQTRLVTDSAGDPTKTKARQRPFREGERPEDALTAEQMDAFAARHGVQG